MTRDCPTIRPTGRGVAGSQHRPWCGACGSCRSTGRPATRLQGLLNPAPDRERRAKDGFEAPAPVYPRRTETAPKHRPRWIEPERHEEAERIDAPHAFEAAHPRRWREPEAERFYDAERSEVSPDVETGRRSRW